VLDANDETRIALANLPTLGEWPDLPLPEQERRQAILNDIAKRIRENGPRHATASPDRGRLFMPFSALKGYDELMEETERNVNGSSQA
jgi:hypothetical protein